MEKFVLPSIMPNIFQRLLFGRNLSNLFESGYPFIVTWRSWTHPNYADIAQIPWVFILASSCEPFIMPCMIKFISLPSKSDQKNHPPWAWLLTESPVVIIKNGNTSQRTDPALPLGKDQGEMVKGKEHRMFEQWQCCWNKVKKDLRRAVRCGIGIVFLCPRCHLIPCKKKIGSKWHGSLWNTLMSSLKGQ